MLHVTTEYSVSWKNAQGQRQWIDGLTYADCVHWTLVWTFCSGEWPM